MPVCRAGQQSFAQRIDELPVLHFKLISTLDRLHAWGVSMHSEDSEYSQLCRFQLKIIKSAGTLNTQDMIRRCISRPSGCAPRVRALPRRPQPLVCHPSTNVAELLENLQHLSTWTLPSCSENIEIVRPYVILNPLYSHDLIKHLVDIARGRASGPPPTDRCRYTWR